MPSTDPSFSYGTVINGNKNSQVACAIIQLRKFLYRLGLYIALFPFSKARHELWLEDPELGNSDCQKNTSNGSEDLAIVILLTSTCPG
jgi:hypothetical protein